MSHASDQRSALGNSVRRPRHPLPTGTIAPGAAPHARPTPRAGAPARRCPVPRGADPRPEPSVPRRSHAQAACTSPQNARALSPETSLVRVTHPFHPLSGRECVCVGERSNLYGSRLLLQVADGDVVWAVPREWTDLAVSDPEVVLGAGRACFCVRDLLALAWLVARLRGSDRPDDV